MAGALNRPDPRADGVTAGEAQRSLVAAPVTRHRLLRDDGARGRNHDRKHVPVAVRVDANDVIHFICKHSD